ncbi:MAG: DNA alkylation repair protein [archaeon]|nr:DNA alkylation repair protein [archaeon]
MNGQELDALINSLAEPGYREFHSKLVPGEETVRGVRLPKMRAIAKDICKGDWREFLTYEPTCYEFTMIRAIVIATAKMDIDERLELTEKFLPEITNWAVNDTFCCSWKINKNDDPEKLWRYCQKLIDRHEEFPSRVGAVMMMDHFIDEEHIDAINEKLVSCPRCGYYLDMGIAWALSFCYIKFPERTEKVIFDGRLENEVLTMTVRKICDSYRVEKSEKERLKKRLKETRQKA